MKLLLAFIILSFVCSESRSDDFIDKRGRDIRKVAKCKLNGRGIVKVTLCYAARECPEEYPITNYDCLPSKACGPRFLSYVVGIHPDAKYVEGEVQLPPIRVADSQKPGSRKEVTPVLLIGDYTDSAKESHLSKIKRELKNKNLVFIEFKEDESGTYQMRGVEGHLENQIKEQLFNSFFKCPQLKK